MNQKTAEAKPGHQTVPGEAEAEISPSGSRLSRTGARADIFRTCGSRVLAGDYRYTFVSADQSCHQGGGGARAISEGVSLGCEVSTG